MLRSSLLLPLLAVVALAAPPAAALPLSLEFGFSTAPQGLEPEGLAFSSSRGTIIASDGASFFGNLYEYQLDGTFVGTISAPLGRIRGIDIRPDTGTVLYATGGNRRVAEYDADLVTLTTGGIDFLVPIEALGSGSDPTDVDIEAVVYHPDRNTLFIADDGRGLILEFDLAGNRLNFLDTRTLPIPAADELDGPSGMTVDPFTGNLIVTDDSSGGNGRVFEITPDFQLVEFSDNEVLTRSLAVCNAVNGPNVGCVDGEAVGYDAGTGTFLFAFENEQVITGALVVPEPASLALVALAVAGLVLRRRG